MTNDRGVTMSPERYSFLRQKLGNFLGSDPTLNFTKYDVVEVESHHNSNTSAAGSPENSTSNSNSNSNEGSPYSMSPWNQSSPYTKSPWILPSFHDDFPCNGLIGSLVREEGHVYSIATSGDKLYTGSDSKNIRVWRNLNDFTGFKSNSGFVKAIVIHEGKIFTGHQDGKIRIWKASSKRPNVHKRIGALPTLRDFIKSSIRPKNYVQIRRGRNVLRIKHYDAVSCLSLDEDRGLLYSGSWDRTLKVWRISDFKCLESINAHDDAINSVVAGFGSLVFTGGADGKVKVWRRENQGRRVRHYLDQVLLKQENAVTALAVNESRSVVYSGASDGLVNFWEREKHLTHGGVLRGHKMAVLCLATGGNLVFSGSADKTICVWRKENDGVHTCLSVLTGHTGPVKCLAVAEEESDGGEYSGDDGDDRRWRVYSGSLDRSVKVWRVFEHAPDLVEMRVMGKQLAAH